MESWKKNESIIVRLLIVCWAFCLETIFRLFIEPGGTEKYKNKRTMKKRIIKAVKKWAKIMSEMGKKMERSE